jgi:hypothetical protein
MFTEITGNADLYVQEACPCLVYCRQSCLSGCSPEIPTVVVRFDDLVIIQAERDADQN